MIERMKKVCIYTTASITMKTFVVETEKYLSENCGNDITLICHNAEKFKKLCQIRLSSKVNWALFRRYGI